MIKFAVFSVFVDDQEKARRFYTDTLGFRTKNDVPVGDDRWLTIASPDGPDDVELLLEPNGTDLAATYQRGLYDMGLPAVVFAVDDISREYERLSKLGVAFRGEPAPMGPVTVVLLDDTCGNLIQLAERNG